MPAPPMRVGVFARTFPGTDPAAVLDAVAGAGFASVHWNMASAGLPALPDAVPPGLAAGIGAAARARGLAVAGLSGTANLIHPDPAERAAGLARLSNLVDVAAAMGAPLVTLCTGTRDRGDPWRSHPGNADPSAWADLLAAMERLLPRAEAAGVRLGVEPERANVVDGPAKARALVDALRSPALAIVLDPANLFEAPPDAPRLRDVVADAVDLLADRIAMVHAKDRDRQGRVVAAGTGVIDWPHLAARLRAAGVEGDVVAHGLSPAEAPAVARLLRDVFA